LTLAATHHQDMPPPRDPYWAGKAAARWAHLCSVVKQQILCYKMSMIVGIEYKHLSFRWLSSQLYQRGVYGLHPFSAVQYKLS